ncbi:hypothetical protein Pgy4_40075, partial [Pseudomonas savastanoi pv. glycinea str. race 4]
SRDRDPEAQGIARRGVIGSIFDALRRNEDAERPERHAPR